MRYCVTILEKLEKVQKRTTKLIIAVKLLKHEERLYIYISIYIFISTVIVVSQ